MRNGAHLGGKWSKSCLLEGLPPFQELRELLLPEMDLQLKLAEGKRFACGDIPIDERCQGLELVAFDINLEDIDVRVAWKL